MLSLGLLMGSGTYRSRLVDVSGTMPGAPSCEWEVALALAGDAEASACFAGAKVGCLEGSKLAPGARIMRCFVRREVERRLREVEFLCSEFRRFLPQEAAEKRKTREQLDSLLASLEED